VHSADYVQAVRTGTPRALAQSQGFTWDPALWTAACSSTGGVIAAAFAALQDGVAGSLSSGLHHAERHQGKGFCTFNGLVVAALALVRSGLRSVLILDLDAHCGGGTHSLVADHSSIWQMDVSVAPFDSYSPRGRNTLDVVEQPENYLRVIADRLRDIKAPLPDLCLYNAGMDPCELCDVGGLAGITSAILQERETLVFDWGRSQGTPIAFVLAGGYVGDRLDEEGLIALHRLTIAAAADMNS
jgi:acetoin utilization deacetylase AcuC-like enzyme